MSDIQNVFCLCDRTFAMIFYIRDIGSFVNRNKAYLTDLEALTDGKSGGGGCQNGQLLGVKEKPWCGNFYQ